MSGVEEYTRKMMETAAGLWGKEAAEEMRGHIEGAAKAVWAVGGAELELFEEPATRLIHGREER